MITSTHQLKFIYANGSKKIVNLHDTFFYPTDNREYTPEQIHAKAYEIGAVEGQIYEMIIIRDNSIIIRHIDDRYNPTKRTKKKRYFRDKKGIYIFSSLREAKQFLYRLKCFKK